MEILKKTKRKKKPQKGRLIVIDGIDGSGKATQAEKLANELTLGGFEVETIDFPQYGKLSSKLVEEYLQGKIINITPEASSIFYAIDRFEASEKIKNWLLEGKVVVANRYVFSNAGHQGGKIKDRMDRIKFFRWLDNLEYNIFQIPRPDLNIILHVPVQMAQELVEKRIKIANEKAKTAKKKKDIHEADLNHLKHAEAVYLEAAKLFPKTQLVKCVKEGRLLSIQEISNKVWELVRRIVLKDVKPKN